MTFHTITAVLGAAIFFISSLITIPINWILGKINPEAAERMTYPLVRWGFRMITLGSGVKAEVIGLENVPQDRPVLFTANHRSIFDVIIGAPYLPCPYTIVAKKELGKIPLLHYWMVQIHCFFLDREDIKSGVKMVADTAKLMKDGYNVLIFPEGTRSKKEGTFGEFKGGCFKIAIRAGAPIVPVTFIRTGDIFEDHMLKIYNRKIRIVFGKPIETQGMPTSERKTLPNRVQAIVEETYRTYDLEK